MSLMYIMEPLRSRKWKSEVPVLFMKLVDLDVEVRSLFRHELVLGKVAGFMFIRVEITEFGCNTRRIRVKNPYFR